MARGPASSPNAAEPDGPYWLGGEAQSRYRKGRSLWPRSRSAASVEPQAERDPKRARRGARRHAEEGYWAVKPILVGVSLAILLLTTYALPARPGLAAPTTWGAVASGPTNGKVIALAFEGGSPAGTVAILNELRRAYVPATFFFLGSAARPRPGLLGSVIAAGNQVGDEGLRSVDLQSLSTPQVVTELTQSQSILLTETGSVPRWFLAPFGDLDARIAGIAASLALTPVTPMGPARGSRYLDDGAFVEAVVSSAQPGAIIFFPRSRTGEGRTVRTLAPIVAKLKYQGYRLGTLDQLFGLAPLPSCVPDPAGLFAADGIRASTGHAIYKSWLGRLCRGIRFGPATGEETSVKHGTVVQNFATTGRRLQFNPATGRVTVVLMWGWGARIFAARKIKPRYGDPITRAWFARYFQGSSPGPALGVELSYGTHVVQHFRRGWAIESSNGTVQWRTTIDTKILSQS